MHLLTTAGSMISGTPLPRAKASRPLGTMIMPVSGSGTPPPRVLLPLLMNREPPNNGLPPLLRRDTCLLPLVLIMHFHSINISVSGCEPQYYLLGIWCMLKLSGCCITASLHFPDDGSVYFFSI